MGFQSPVAVLAARPDLSRERWNDVASILLTLRPDHSQDLHDRWVRGTRLKKVPLSLRVQLSSEFAVATASPETGTSQTTMPRAPFSFQCPGMCGFIHTVSIKPTPIGTSWPLMWCPQCGRSKRVGKG
eukprot:8852939-Alexandrium_andersonii.AAC.1